MSFLTKYLQTALGLVLLGTGLWWLWLANLSHEGIGLDFLTTICAILIIGGIWLLYRMHKTQ